MSVAETTVVAPQEDTSLRGAFNAYVDKLRGGELGSLPAVLGLIAIVLIFTVLQGNTFFSTFNFANLLTQSAMIIVLAMGLVFVLLLGEIDLSAGMTFAAMPPSTRTALTTSR